MAPPPVPAGESPGRHEKVTAFVGRTLAAPESKPHVPAGGLDAFGSEEETPAEVANSTAVVPQNWTRISMWVGAVVAVVVLGVAAAAFRPTLTRQTPSTLPGHVTIGTTPLGAEITIDGQARGLTPVSVQLDPGSHSVILRRGAEERTITVQVAAGAQITQHYEFAPQPVAVARTSTLSITSDPPGARVLINGEARGVSPVTVPNLPVARHRVTVVGEHGSVERQVTSEAGVTSSLVVSLPKAPPLSAGWLSVSSPFEVQVIERGDIIGTSASPRFMVPAGAHDVDLVNVELGYSERRRVDITAGATAAVKIEARATINANARPWAEVFVDGKSVGQTPLSNLSLNLGSHQIVFRHPDLGERQETILVTAKGPNRIAVDLTR